MREIVEILEIERKLFEEMKRSIEAQKIAMIDRDLDAMNEALLRTERIAVEIDEIDRKRHELFKSLKRSLNLSEDSSLEELLAKLEGSDREEFVDAISKFLSAVNDLAAELEGLKEMMEFENAYFEFLMGVLSGETRGVYDRKGSYGKALRTGSFSVRW